MKRPISVYFVAAWCFLALTIQASSLSHLIAPRLSEGPASESLRTALFGTGFILTIWHVVRLVQLKSFNRWFSIVFFGLWTMTLTWNTFVLLPRVERPLRPVLVFTAFGMLNVASAWYLARRRFRQFAVQFVAEREGQRYSQMMQKASQKKIAHDLRR